MKLEQQVISLELAKRLKELGVKQESVFWWFTGNKAVEPFLRQGVAGQTLGGFERPESFVAAYAVAELGEMFREYPYLQVVWMPAWKEDGSESYAKLTDINSRHKGGRVCDVHGKKEELTQAEAWGLMLAYLIENNLMSV